MKDIKGEYIYMTYKSVFLDIDGTILKPDHTYSNSTKEAIIQLKKQGIDVFFATGRPLHELSELAKQLNIDSFIGYNGAYAVYQDKTILNEPMDQKVIEEFIKISKDNGQEIVFYTSEKNYFTSLDSPIVKSFIELFGLYQNECFTDEISGQILGITILDLNQDQIEKYETEGNIHLSQVNIEGFTHCYDVIRSNVNKGKAVQCIFDLLDITKEQAIAFGDGMNDKEMLETVGEGFAMGNANPDLIPYAKHQTTSVSDEGIFNGLQKLGLVR